MANGGSKPRMARIILGTTGTVVLLGSLLLYGHRSDHPMLYYYGASPEAPGGKAVPILNPLRNRKDEANAEWLIRDLRTNQCGQIVRERLRANDGQICPVLRSNTKANLIWLDRERSAETRSYSRRLIYDLQDSKARLVVYFRNSEVGWGVDTVSVLTDLAVLQPNRGR